MGLKDYKFYRDIKTLKREIRENLIRIMPRQYKYPDAIYLKEHLGAIVRITAAMYITEDLAEKSQFADSILYELYVIQEELEEQEECRVLSLKSASSMYLKIEQIIQQLYKFKSYLKKRESDGLRSTESAVKH